MGKAIPYDCRVKIVERMKLNAKASELAEEMGYSESGVKKIWYSYNKYGEEIYYNKYGNCGRKSAYPKSVRQTVEEIRDNHQGGSYVRSKLEQRNPNEKSPSERTLQRWWLAAGSNRAKGRPLDKEKKVEPKGSSNVANRW